MADEEIDIEALEQDYRLNQQSISEICRKHGVSKSTVRYYAGRYGWLRDQGKSVRAATMAKLQGQELPAGTNGTPIDAAADTNVRVITKHREILHSLRTSVEDYAQKLRDISQTDPERLDPDVIELMVGKNPTETLERLTRSIDKLIRLERQAYNLDDAGFDENDFSKIDWSQLSDSAMRELLAAMGKKPKEVEEEHADFDDEG